MNNRVDTGLARLLADSSIQARMQGNIGYLCHSASVTPGLEHGALALKRLFGPRLKALFAPQHGFATDAQDNMIESPHFFTLSCNSPFTASTPRPGFQRPKCWNPSTP
ncbi:MAG: hypothetical protein IPN20_03940 [Haliscomenobacter sp.]|nr:hypothetical protein [Haliscomenobacter sp.]